MAAQQLHHTWLLYTRTMGWKPRLWEGRKLWNYSGSGRKSVGPGILAIEMLSLLLITALIRYGVCHRDPGADSGALSSADALLEKSKSLRKRFISACEDGYVVERSLFNHCKGICTPFCAEKYMPSFSSRYDYSQLLARRS